jgi:hypothetical protein
MGQIVGAALVSHHPGLFQSDEMPWYLYGQDYRYEGAPDLAALIENVVSVSTCQNCQPRTDHESNVSRPENIAADKAAIALFEQGRHDVVVGEWDQRFRKLPCEGFGGHDLQMVGALGGTECRAKARVMSDYENARGTGNVHLWFEVAG